MHNQSRILLFRTVSHCFGLLLTFLPALAFSAQLAGRVVGIADGDTLTLLDAGNQQYKVRIGGIDAPEKRQAFGQRSKENLSRLAFSKTAQADCPKQDRYRRHVCTVTVDGRDVGLEQIRAGLAWWYRKYADEQPAAQRVDYENAEATARRQRAGLWMESAPVPPWEFRHPPK